MKFESTKLKTFLIFLLLVNIFVAKDEKEDKKKDDKKKKGMAVCNQHLLDSYLLRGRKHSKNDKNLLCPLVEKNCCTKLDQQFMYHVVNDIIPPKTTEYLTKMKMVMAKFKIFHEFLVKKEPHFQGTKLRLEFCETEYRKLENYEFNKLYKRILKELENMRHHMGDFYETFFCVLCDADNHKYINTKGKKVTLDFKFCKNMLTNNRETTTLFNVTLLEYLKIVQNVVDCHHYIHSYNLDFIDPVRWMEMEHAKKCVENISTKQFQKQCENTCARLTISKINPLLEGDFNFLIEAINIFEKFIEMKEGGNIVSMRLRKFFKQFEIPLKLTQENKKQIIRQLRQKKKTVQSRKLVDLALKNKSLFEEEQQISQDAQNEFANMLNQEKGERELLQVDEIDNQQRLLQKPINNIFEANALVNNNIGKMNLGEGRVLEKKEDDKKNQNKKKNSKKNQDGKKDSKKKKVKDIKYAKLFYDKELDDFYKEITVVIPKEEDYIFHVPRDPVDVDKFKKVFVEGQGLDPLMYEGMTGFSMSHDEFYMNLFKYRRADPADANLVFFLGGFTPKAKQELIQNLTIPFEEDKKKKKKKKGKKGKKGKEDEKKNDGRLLSLKENKRINKFQTLKEFRELH